MFARRLKRKVCFPVPLLCIIFGQMWAQGCQSWQDWPPLNIYKKQWITGCLKHFFNGTNHVVTCLHSSEAAHILLQGFSSRLWAYRSLQTQHTQRNRGVMSKNPPGAYISLIAPASLKWHWHIRGIAGKHCSLNRSPNLRVSLVYGISSGHKNLHALSCGHLDCFGWPCFMLFQVKKNNVWLCATHASYEHKSYQYAYEKK